MVSTIYLCGEMMKKLIVFTNTLAASLSQYNPIKAYLDEVLDKDEWVNFDSTSSMILEDKFLSTIGIKQTKETYAVYSFGVAAQQVAMVKSSDKRYFINPCLGGIMQNPNGWAKVFTDNKFLGGYEKVLVDIPYDVYTATETGRVIDEDEYDLLTINVKEYFNKIETTVPDGTTIH